MTERATAPLGARERSTYALERRPLASAARLAGRSALVATIGLILSAGVTGNAVAPAGATSDYLGARRTFQLDIPAVSTVSVAPIVVGEHLTRTEADDSRPVVLQPSDYASIDAFDHVPLPAPEEEEPLQNPFEVLEFGKMKVHRWIVDAVLKAADKTGADPVFMMALADKESSLAPEVSARTSSAEGLYQFITQTWLECVSTFGAKHGLGAEAALIKTNNATGERTVESDEDRERILALRRDPYVAGLMAGEMLARDRARIQDEIGRPMTFHEVYMAHFLGPSSATRFLKLKDEKPKETASKQFPAAARANRAIFFEKAGKKTKKLSVAEVYERIESMIDYRLDRYTDLSTVAQNTDIDRTMARN